MRRLLTGYAVSYNRRHRRSGHLFQNRFKSILCQEDLYLAMSKARIHLKGDERILGDRECSGVGPRQVIDIVEKMS